MLRSRKSHVLVAALLLAGAAVSFGQAAQPSATEQEGKLIAVLKSDAPHKEKADACRDLARIGTTDAVPPLAAMLGDEKLSHMARYALEPMPDPAVDDALRNALGKLKGRLRVGVIGSIGVRRDAKAVDALIKLLNDDDADTAQAAARALGKIGTSAAAKALTGALANVPAANQLDFCEGLFRCAEALVAKGRRDEAIAIYDRLRGLKKAPHQVCAGAVRSRSHARGGGLPLLLEAVRGDDFVLVAAAARTAMEMPDAEVTQALAGELGKLSADKQILIIQTLGKRGDAGALPALFAAAKSGEKTVRVAAIRAFPPIGDATAAPVLVQLLGDADGEVAEAAQENLAALPGSEVDAEVTAMLKAPDAGTRRTGVELLGRRRVRGALPALLKAAGEDGDESVRVASIKVLGNLAGAAELPAMLGLLMKAKSPGDTEAFGSALAAICLRQTDRAAYADALIADFGKAVGAPKLALLRVLRSVGGAKALNAVRTAARDSDAQVKDTALCALCEWQTLDVLPDLARLARTSADAKIKTLALRGYLRLIPQQDVPAEKKLASLKDAMALVQRDAEKKLALAVLGGIPLAEALALVMPHVGTPGLKEEACMAAVGIAEKIAKSHPAQVAEAMQQVLKTTADKRVAGRARRLLQQTRKAAPRK